MVDCKSSRKYENIWDHFSTKNLLHVIVLVLTFTTCANALKAESVVMKIDCPESNTCTTCTKKPLCSWSVELQACLKTKLLQAPRSNLIIHNETHCPRFTVVNKSSVAGASFKYTVRILNDAEGAVAAFLNSSTITCCIESCDFRGSVVDDSIVCVAIRTPRSYFADGATALISYIYVMFGNKTLRYDDDADHYYTIYDRDCAVSVATAAADDCATCLWNDAGYKHYLKLCPTGHPCTGSYWVYDKRDEDGNMKFRFAAADDEVVRIRCAELSILSVRPLYAPRTGSGTTTMTITVRNHRMLAENRTVTVAVAGRHCEYPVMYDDRTITCSVPQSSASVAAAGPVEVVYTSSSSSRRRTTRFALRSSETVGFVDPETTSVRPTCGPASGGSTLTVRGRFLDTGNAVRVTVVADAGEKEAGETVIMTCDTVSRDRHTIVCRTAAAVRHNGDYSYNASAGVSSARVKVQFDGGPIKYVQSPASWTVCAGGDAAFDAGQTFAGTVSGGTAVPVRGVRFQCVADAQFYVHDRDGVIYQHAAGCRVVNDTYMECRSPDMRHATAAVDVPAALPDFGVRARYCGEDRSSDLPALQLRSSATAVRSPFSVYADPVYVGFEIRDGAVVITGGHSSTSGWGYAADDVAVRFRNSTGGCRVMSVSRHEIVCTPTPSTTATVLDQLRRVVVTVGGDGGYACDVHKNVIDVRKDVRGGQLLLFTGVTFSCCRGVAIVFAAMLLIAFIVGVLLLRIVMKNRYVISADT
ncbi:plexin A3-like [Rhopalosiphum maidis]|uniref:plexin A3-like n=1 Tax=Rhopalosiphum maidis TaxID=43146 RepID=UPI000EFF360A|nr:plexin A3-like [Rhopalosiphum maidis]